MRKEIIISRLHYIFKILSEVRDTSTRKTKIAYQIDARWIPGIPGRYQVRDQDQKSKNCSPNRHQVETRDTKAIPGAIPVLGKPKLLTKIIPGGYQGYQRDTRCDTSTRKATIAYQSNQIDTMWVPGIPGGYQVDTRCVPGGY